MRLSKRIVSMLLVAVFAFVSMVPAFAADFSDLTSGSQVYEAVSVLSKLGVINGYEDGTFKPDNNVTRAEFTAMLLRARGLGSLGSTSLENPPFPDVSTSDVSWAIGNIRTAREMGIINGYEDGTFRPNNNVLYEEAIKMVVCSLGYANYSPEGTEWYSKYIITANSLKILDKVGGSVGIPATRAMIATMLYNCLEVKIAENNEQTSGSVLENDLKLTKKVGVIASNGETSLSAPDVNLRDDEIQIEAPNDANTGNEIKTYKVDNAAQYKDMLGMQITFYYSNDGTSNIQTITLANVKNSTTKTLNAKDIEPAQCTSSVIAYYENDTASSAKTISIANDSAVILGGKLYGANAAASTYAQYFGDNGKNGLPTIGSIKLIDTEGDGTYDIVFIDKYDAYLVTAVTSSSYTIVDDMLRKDLPNKGNQIVINPTDNSRDVTILDENGKETSFSAIKKGSVVCVKSSNTSNGGRVKIEAVVSNKTVSGTVKGISAGKSVTIGSTTYKYSDQAPWVNQISGSTKVLDEPKMGDTGKFYLDMYGNVIGYDKNEVASNQQYGYVMNAIYDEGKIDDATLYLHILNASGQKVKYKAITKTKLNGTAYDTLEQLKDAILATSENAILSGKLYDWGSVTNAEKGQQVVKFTTTTNKGETVLDEIVSVVNDGENTTIVSAGQEVVNDKLTFLDSVSGDTALKYYSANKQLKGSGQTINIKNAVVYNVPADRGDTNKYTKTTASGLSNETNYNVVLYDVTAAGSAGVVVVYHGMGDTTEVKANSPVVVVKSIGKENNESEGVAMYKIEGFNGSTAVSYWGSTDTEDAFAKVREGDVIRLGKDTDGYYTLKEEHIVFSTADNFRGDVKVYDRADGLKTVAEKGDVYIDSDDNDSWKETKEYPTPTYRAIWGSALTKDDDYLKISTKLLTGADSDDTSETYSIERSKFANAKIYIYDMTGSGLDMDADKVYVPTADNQGTIDALDMYTAGERSSELFIIMSGENVKTMIIVKR